MIEKITLIGLGAMGCFFAPRWYECYGENLRVLANGERKKRLETEGVWVNGIRYIFPVMDTDVKEPADLIIIATKDTGLEQALADIKNQVGEHTIIMAVLNGVESTPKQGRISERLAVIIS